MVEHLADEEGYRAFVRVRDGGRRHKSQLGGANGLVVSRQMDDRQRAVFAGGVLLAKPYTI